MKLKIRDLFGLAALAGLACQSASASPMLAQISLNIGVEAGPPPPQVEVVTASPGPGFVWVGGYWDGAPGHYQWSRGHWDRPPNGRGNWVAPRYEKGNDGHYRKVEGGWR